ncbi:TPA: hypothetical protein OT801_003947 [Morganella morganii]|uniref:hypothetical protein n=1 Tax=Morganella morganii TaxID=582 RepID=UPI00091CDCA2|nr:hypothetical protein [Morganella morganii]SGC57602.1 Uncharacterised protein [Mycobacterium tuberculosis]ELA7727099.1 hypothetical protein [Morganella morganii]ELA7729891.1 hypothetical protein [Morganella morganii]MBC3998584.1 hypothetical protein [Morganella morganii]MBT0314082.1 hypothetical protein [Morganella morganii subsp. morganii]
MQRIKYVYYLNSWDFGDDINVLISSAEIVTPEEYRPEMESNIYCPKCYTPLVKVPKNRPQTTDGKQAYFSHKKSYLHIECKLRSLKGQEKYFDSEELARQAIENGNLVIIQNFLERKPQIHTVTNEEFGQIYVEDTDGNDVAVQIGRHNGEIFSLPSNITTVAGLCRNFDKNYYKYYLLPNERNPERLDRLLTDIKTVSDINDIPKLYYAKIISSSSYSADTSIRMTRLDWGRNGSYSDFYFKQRNGDCRDRGLTDRTPRGQYILMYGKVTTNGTGLCIEALNWGEFALLPEKYNKILDIKNLD